MSDSDKNKIAPPEIGPFVFPSLLLIFGLWCFYDGWLNSNPAMQEYLLLNRIGSLVLLPWAAIDFIRTWKINKAGKSPSAASPEGEEEKNS